MTTQPEGKDRPKPKTDGPTRPKKVALSRIVMDPAIQPRLRMSKDAVARYVQYYRNAPKELPPVLLATIGTSQRLVLIDGYH